MDKNFKENIHKTNILKIRITGSFAGRQVHQLRHFVNHNSADNNGKINPSTLHLPVKQIKFTLRGV